MKSNKGVTLIALVITIIVLLILAGVSISLVVGDSGVFSRGRDATVQTQISGLEEALNRAVASAQGVYTGTEYFTSGKETFFEWLKAANASSVAEGHDKIADVFNENGYKITFKQDETAKLTGFICETNKDGSVPVDAKGLNFEITDGAGSGYSSTNNRLKFKIKITNGLGKDEKSMKLETSGVSGS